jgi:hypothetical protein
MVYVVCMTKYKKLVTKFWFEKLIQRYQVRDQDVDGKITLKYMLGKYNEQTRLNYSYYGYLGVFGTRPHVLSHSMNVQRPENPTTQ